MDNAGRRRPAAVHRCGLCALSVSSYDRLTRHVWQAHGLIGMVTWCWDTRGLPGQVLMVAAVISAMLAVGSVLAAAGVAAVAAAGPLWGAR